MDGVLAACDHSDCASEIIAQGATGTVRIRDVRISYSRSVSFLEHPSFRKLLLHTGTYEDETDETSKFAIH